MPRILYEKVKPENLKQFVFNLGDIQEPSEPAQ